MATISPYTGDGVTRDFDVTFSYKESDSVGVRVNGADVAFSFLTVSRVRTDVAPAVGAAVEVYRETSVTDPKTVFQDGQILRGKDLNDAVGQVLNRSEELGSEVAALSAVSVRVNPGEAPLVMPRAADRTDKALFFDGAGKPTVISVEDFSAAAREAAAAAEALTGPTYGSVAAGLSATAEGGFFSVVIGDIVTVYRKTAGAAVYQRDAYTAASITSTASNRGAGLPGFSHASSYQPGTVGSSLKAFVVCSDLPWGVKGDDATDNAGAINAALAHCAALGGGDVLLPGGQVRIAASIDNIYPNVRILGRGGDTSHGAGTAYTGKTVLRWFGATGGTMVRSRTPYGATTQRRYGQGVVNVEFDGRSLAAYGLEINSIVCSDFDRIHIRHCTSAQYYLPCGVTGVDGPAGEALDTQHCRFTRCTFDSRAANSYGSTTAKGWYFLGSTNANISGNYFEMLNGIYTEGTAYDLLRADNNVFLRSSAFRATGSSASYTWLLAGSNGSTGTGAYGNTFIQIGWNNVYGFRFDTSVAADSINTRVNTIFGYDEANGGAFPSVGGNSRLFVSSSKGVMEGIARLGIAQLGAGPNDGISISESGIRHDLYVSGNTLIYGGNGFAGTFQATGNFNVISAVGAYKVDGVQVVQTRKTGWSPPTGTATRSAFATSSVTLPQLAERVKALIDDLTTHGLIGA